MSEQEEKSDGLGAAAPIESGFKDVDGLHAAYETLKGGSLTWGELGHETSEATELSPALGSFNAGLGVIGGIGGAVEIAEGTAKAIDAKKTDDKADGVVHAMEGGADVFGAGATLLGTGGSGGALGSAGGPVSAAGVAGMMIGHYRDEQGKKFGTYGKGTDGQNLSASDAAAVKGSHAEEWVREHDSGPSGKVLAPLAGAAVTGAETVGEFPTVVRDAGLGVFDWMME